MSDDWRLVDSRVTAWFAAPTMAAGAALVRRVAETTIFDADLRPGGVRIRLPGRDHADPVSAGVSAAVSATVSAAARELGLVADPTVLQTMSLVVESADPSSVTSFWRTALGYRDKTPHQLTDPLGRQPSASVRTSPPRPGHDRIHVDVARAPDAVTSARAAIGQEPTGPYGLALADADGNVVDLVPGGGIAEDPATADWQAVFAAMVHYPVDSPARALDLMSAVATLADAAGVRLLVDVRADGVTIDSGKDLWEDESGSVRDDFRAVAAAVQAAAHELGLVAEPAGARFVQLGIAAHDVPTVRAFWTTLLGYEPDPRSFLTDIVDPRRLNPVVFFQQIEEPTPERMKHRNRMRVALQVPPDGLQLRLDAALAAGGRVITEDRIAAIDPEGNEIDLVTSDASNRGAAGE